MTSTSISSRDISPSLGRSSQGLEQREIGKLDGRRKRVSVILTAIETLTVTIKDNNTQVRQPHNASIQPKLSKIMKVLTDLSSNTSVTREENLVIINRTRAVHAEDDGTKFRIFWERVKFHFLWHAVRTKACSLKSLFTNQF